MLIIYGVIIFWFGLITGFILLRWRMRKYSDFSGTIYVNYDEIAEKVVYSLVLDEYPEKLEFKKVVVFKVDASDQNQDRE